MATSLVLLEDCCAMRAEYYFTAQSGDTYVVRHETSFITNLNLQTSPIIEKNRICMLHPIDEKITNASNELGYGISADASDCKCQERVKPSDKINFVIASIFPLRDQWLFSIMPLVMNKAELIEAVQTLMGKEATKRVAEDAVTNVLEAIAAGIKNSQKVQIIGFGTFSVKKRPARQGRNPKTGESMPIPASKSVGFKVSSTLKASL